jgi:hypothetical protein
MGRVKTRCNKKGSTRKVPIEIGSKQGRALAMPAKEKINLIVSRPISIFRKKKQEFSSFLLTLRKKNITKMELAI